MAYLSPFANEKELTKIGKDIDKDLRDAMKAVNVLTELHVKMKAPKITASMGRVPKAIFTNSPVTQVNILNQLPPELQRMIWSYLVHQADRMALALTCKQNAQMQAELKRGYDKIAIKSVQKFHRLAVLVRIKTWMGNEWRLCFHCVRFLPPHTRGGKDWGGNTMMVHERYIRGGRLNAESYIKGPKCPRCCYRDGVDALGHKSTVKEYKALLIRHVGAFGTA